jgi:hypothetical protein
MRVCTTVPGKAALIASGKPFSPSTTDQYVLDTGVPELVHHREPELRPLVLGDPHAQDLALPVSGDAEREVDGLVSADPAVLVADLHPERVEDHHRVDRVQRPRLPFLHLVEHRVCDPAEQVGRDLKPVMSRMMV